MDVVSISFPIFARISQSKCTYALLLHDNTSYILAKVGVEGSEEVSALTDKAKRSTKSFPTNVDWID